MGLKGIYAGLVLGVTFGAQAIAADAMDHGAFEKARAEAAAAVAQAAKLKGEWRDSGKLLEQADKAAAEGNMTKAISLAETARREGELGYAQAMAERNAGDPAYLR